MSKEAVFSEKKPRFINKIEASNTSLVHNTAEFIKSLDQLCVIRNGISSSILPTVKELKAYFFASPRNAVLIIVLEIYVV